MTRCTADRCNAARPENCRACLTRKLLTDTMTVSVRSLDGERASLIRVFFPDGGFEDHKVPKRDGDAR